MAQHSNDLIFDIVYAKYQEDAVRGARAHNGPAASISVDRIREKVAGYLVALASRLEPAEVTENRQGSIQTGAA